MASRCGRFYAPIPTYLIPRIFPLQVSLLPLFVCGSEPMSVPLSSGKGQQTIRVTSRPNAPKAFATDKIFLLRSVFYRRRALPFPLIVCPLWPSKRNRHTPSFERKKNVSTMKTERSYHSPNRFETKRRLLALPHKIVWIVVCCIVALKAIGVSEELTAILMLFAFVYLIRATLQIAFRLLFFLIRWICIAAALAWIVCRLLL